MHDLSLKKILKIKPISLSNIFFRLVALKHVNDILNPQGNYTCGGRYNPPREFTVLYLGDSENVCKAERNAKTNPNLLTSQVFRKNRNDKQQHLHITSLPLWKPLIFGE